MRGGSLIDYVICVLRFPRGFVLVGHAIPPISVWPSLSLAFHAAVTIWRHRFLAAAAVIRHDHGALILTVLDGLLTLLDRLSRSNRSPGASIIFVLAAAYSRLTA